MKTGKTAILVFDGPLFDPRALDGPYDKIYMFSLTADWDTISRVSGNLKEAGLESETLDSSRIINDEAPVLRDKFIEWAAAIGNHRISSGTVRSRLLLPGGRVSAWWFSLLADKDPVKNPLFLRIIQASCIIREARVRNCGVIIALEDRVMRNILGQVLSDNKIDSVVLPDKKHALKDARDRLVRRMPVKAVSALGRSAARGLYLKMKLPPAGWRRAALDGDILFFTYFPSIAAADKGKAEFRNKFASPLQDICWERGKKIAWVLLYADIDGYSFGEAVKMAGKFIANGERMFFDQEFLGLRALFKSVYDYARIRMRWRAVRRELGYGEINAIAGNTFCGRFIIDVLDNSIYGDNCLSGIMQYHIFRNLFRRSRGFSRGVYICEMMAWEAALIAAKRAEGAVYPLTGYQEFAFSRYYFQMFHSKEELKYKNTPDGIPMPDRIGCCGGVPHAALSECYDNVENLENLRFQYLDTALRKTDNSRRGRGDGKFILLVCTNIDLNESRAIAGLIKAAYPGDTGDIEVWFKGHPGLKVQKIFDSLNMGGYTIKEGPVQDFLPLSDAVLVGASSVALEALAYGRDILVYLNPQSLPFSPLTGFEEYYEKVYDPASLRKAVDGLKGGQRADNSEKKREFARNYWNVNKGLDAWKSNLGLGR
ncbi:MAG: hypothetical protein WCY23_00835 [Candidatus Omnitrophota bacterium]